MLTEENARARARAQRDRAAPRPDAGADGDRLGAARPARDLGADRRVAASRSSRTASARCATSSSPTTSWRAIDGHAVEAGINLWKASSDGLTARPSRRPTSSAGRARCWRRPGSSPSAAATVAETLVETSLRGDRLARRRAGAGVRRAPAPGLLNARPQPSVARREGAIAVVDGDQGPGQVAGVFATDLSIELAREHGVGVVAVRRSAHYGAAAFYAMPRRRAGLVALAMTNTEPFVIPYGGAEPALGTNPIALAAPTSRRHLRRRHGDEPGRRQPDLQRARRGPADPGGLGRRRPGEPTTDAAAVTRRCRSAATRATGSP